MRLFHSLFFIGKTCSFGFHVCALSKKGIINWRDMYNSCVENIFKVDMRSRLNAKNMRIYCMNLWKKRWMQYSTHVKSYEQKCVQPYMRRYSPLRIKSSHSGLDLRSRGKILHRLCCAWSNSDRVVDDSKPVRCLFWLFWGKTGKLAPLFVW